MKKTLFSIALIFLAIFFIQSSFASSEDGTIDPNNVGNQNAWSNNQGWINFQIDDLTETIHITDNGFTGHAWSQNLGWINMNPVSSGVKIDAFGKLSGSAWGENTGYIDFSTASINQNGIFEGTATGATIGTINFDCANCTVETDYRPDSFRPTSGGRSNNRTSSSRGSSNSRTSETSEESAPAEAPVSPKSGSEEKTEDSESQQDEQGQQSENSQGEKQEGSRRGAEDSPQSESGTLKNSAGTGDRDNQERVQEPNLKKSSRIIPGQNALPDADPKTCYDQVIDTDNDPEKDAIEFLLEKELFLCPYQLFLPKGPVTRAAAIKLNALAIGLPKEDSFEKGLWYYFWRKKLMEKKIIRGSHSPSRYEPKAEFLAFVMKAKGYDLQNLPTCSRDSYSDVHADYWFCPLVQLAYEKGWIRDQQPFFSPYDLATRSWVAGVIYRAFYTMP